MAPPILGGQPSGKILAPHRIHARRVDSETSPPAAGAGDLEPCSQICQAKPKPLQGEPAKNARISLVLFVRFQTFQSVTATKTKIRVALLPLSHGACVDQATQLTLARFLIFCKRLLKDRLCEAPGADSDGSVKTRHALVHDF